MNWEAVNALATLASAMVVAVAAVAAVLQIRHLRTGNQLEAILRIYEVFNRHEMVVAREFCLYEFPETIAKADLAELARGKFDRRVVLVANFHNEIGALIVDGFLDARAAWPLVPVTARLWRVLAPLAAEMRKTRDDPVWADFEYLASLEGTVSRERHITRYPAAFQHALREHYATKPDDAGREAP